MSGLPAGLPAAAKASLGLLANLDDWHQLDHYTAAFVVLDAGERPVALTLQQHNYLRTYLVGEAAEPGRDGRFDIDVAIRSNELYPHLPARRSRRAVRFLGPDEAAFMMGYGARPMMSADDITDPARTVDYELAFLPGSDAFYTFQGYLGERRLLPGRDGPPGARYNTLPRLKPLPAQILGGLLARAERGRLGTVSPQPGVRLQSGRVRPRTGTGLSSQSGQPAQEQVRLHAAVAHHGAGDLPEHMPWTHRDESSGGVLAQLRHVAAVPFPAEYDPWACTDTPALGPLAQLVEHLTFNQVVVGSIPTRPTNKISYLRGYRNIAITPVSALCRQIAQLTNHGQSG